MPMLITPKEPIPAQAFHLSTDTPKDIWDAADLCSDIGFSLNARWYKDSSPSAPDHTLLAVTIRPIVGATDATTLVANLGDWLTWDGINLVIKTDADVQQVYNLQEPNAIEPSPPTPTPPTQ